MYTTINELNWSTNCVTRLDAVCKFINWSLKNFLMILFELLLLTCIFLCLQSNIQLSISTPHFFSFNFKRCSANAPHLVSDWFCFNVSFSVMLANNFQHSIHSHCIWSTVAECRHDYLFLLNSISCCGMLLWSFTHIVFNQLSRNVPRNIHSY